MTPEQELDMAIQWGKSWVKAMEPVEEEDTDEIGPEDNQPDPFEAHKREREK